MDRARFRRQAAALTAAYAIALQALLSAFVPLAPAVLIDPLAVLCAHEVDDGSGVPLPHDRPCAAICAAIGHGIAGAPPREPAIALIRQHIVVAILRPSEWAPPSLAVRRAQTPRGPPLA